MNGPKRSLPRWRRGLAAVLTAVVAAGLVEPGASAEPYQMPPDRPGRPAVQSYPAVPVDAVAEVPAPTVDTTPGEQRSRAPKGRYSVPLTDAAAGFSQAGDSTIEVAAADAGDGQVTVQVLDASSAAAVGAPGLAVRVTADQPTDVTVKVPADLVRDVIGADFDSRVVWSVAPDGAAASTAQPVATSETTTSEAAGSLTATQVQVQASPAGATLLAASGSTASDGSGSFGATNLAASSSWQMSGNTGSFTWSYPLTAPPATGPAPNLALAYDSGSVDGRTGSTNNQTSGLGEGWDLAGGGFIERSYASCSQDGQATSADLCWSSDNATVSLAGHSGTLVKDGGGTWRLQTDDGTKVEKLTGTSNGDNDGEYWKLTTTDGTQYFFGRNRLPGWASGKPETGSTWTVPVFGNQAGEPCNNSTFATSSCAQAWRWNLDHVVDVHGNAEAFYYDKQQNAYLVNGVTKTTYDMGGYLTRVDYAMRTGNEYGTVPARVVLDNVDRCESTSNCTQSNTSNWPDVPWDLYCLSTACTGKINPSFFTTKKLAAVRTQIHNGTAYVDVDKWAFTQTFPATGDGTSRSLWLASIARTGYGGGTNLTVPAVTFTGTALQNRVWAVDGLAPLMKYRINSITTETGASTAITYSPVDCTPTTLPAAPETNSKRCFPQRWVPPGPAPQTERLDWFHKYVVTAVSVNPGPNSGSPVETTNYDYQGAPAWKYTKEPIVPADKRTWSVYAGYAQVKTRHGDPATPSRQETTLTTYFRGLDGDRLNPAGGTRSVSVAASDGSTFTDSLWLAGQTRETISYVGDGGARVSNTITTPWLSSSIASDGTNEVRRIGTAEVTTRTALAAGGDQTVTTVTSNDDLGRPVTVDDRGDTSTTADDRCTRTSYADNTTLNLLNFPAETTTVGVACAQTPTLPQDALSQSRQYYDGSGTLGEAPTRGLVTRTDVAVSYDGSTPNFQTQSTGTFDDLGRPLTTTDPRLDGNPRTTSTAYTPAAGGLVTKTVITNPLNWTATTTFDPARGSTLTTVDMNGNTTEATYDALGRRTKVWLPNRPRASNASSPSSSYQYTISNTAPSWTSTTTITAAGSPSTIYQLFDGLLRPRQSQTPQTNADARVITDTRYDAAGRLSTTNDAYNATGAPSGTLVNPTVAVPSGTVVKYDGAGRTIADIKLGNGTEMWRTGYTYGGNVVSVTPPAGGTATATVTNAQGKPVQIKQYTAAGTPTGAADTTSYTYDHADRMTSMTDAEGNRWTWSFDLLGRTVTAVDPDAGTTTSTYDAASRIATITDGRGQTVATSYDTLDRPIGRYDTATAGTQLAAWTYDTTAKGQLYEATRIVGADQYTNRVTSYDKLYKPTGQQIVVPASAGAALAGTYTFAMTYGPDGTLTSRTLPAMAGMPSEKLIYGYDTLGRLGGLGSSQGDYLSGVYRTEIGELAQTMRFFGSNSLYQVFTRNASTQRIVTSETLNIVNGAGTTIGKHEYTYNNAGLLTSDRTTATGLAADQQCYRYDYKQQLTDAWTPNATDCAAAPGAAGYAGPAPYRVSYAYGASGNRLRETRHTTTGGTDQIRTYTYPTPGATAVRPHATTNVTITGSGPGTTTFGYDNAGNTTTQGSQTLTYNTEGRLAGITAGASTQNRIYDADGNLLLLTSSTTGTQLFLGETILTATTGATAASGSRIYTAGGLQLAERTTTGTTNTLTYLDANNQNTVTARISTTGAFTRVYHRPYGYTRSPTTTWNSQRGYLGQPHNTQVGLTHLGARDYDPVNGRFTTVDPILAPDNPLQNNGYNYAANNPIQYSDPDGLCFQNSKGFYEGVNCGGPPDKSSGGNAGNYLNDIKITVWKAVPGSGSRPRYVETSYATREENMYSNRNDWSRYSKYYSQDLEASRRVVAGFKFVADLIGITDAVNCARNPNFGSCAMAAAAVTPFGKAAKAASWAFRGTREASAALNTTAKLAGSGPVAGVLEASERVSSVAAIRNLQPKGGGIEYVFDPSTRTFAVGRPAGSAGLSGSPHQQLAQSIGADESTVVGGILRRGSDGKFRTDEQSGHYFQNWTPEVREQFVSTMRSYGLDFEH